MIGRELKKAKRAVRAEVLMLRDAMTQEDRVLLGEAVTERFLALLELEDAGTVLAFWAFGSEVPTEGLLQRLHDRGLRLALPRIVEGDLEPRTYAPGDPVTIAPFGAGEPVGGEVLRPPDIDLVVTPGVAFDRHGGRVGYGGGFYDRFFRRARTDAIRAAICFGLQLVDGPLPGGAFDLPVHLVVTDSEIVRFGRSE